MCVHLEIQEQGTPASDGLYDKVPGALPQTGLTRQAAHFFRRRHGSDFTLG